MKILPMELNRENFKDYGFVISSGAGAPMAENTELTFWGKISEFNMGETLSSGILIGHEREPVIKSLERHVKTPEMLVALEGDSVICFARPLEEGKEKIEGVKAFFSRCSVK